MADREREDRAETTRTERRRRDDTLVHSSNKLAIPPEVAAKLAAEGRSPRWANDENNRIHRLTVLDDYDKVDGVAPVPVGTDASGKPILAHLLSKPNEFIAEDQSKAESRRKGTESGLLRGRVPTKPGEEAAPVRGAHGAEIYVDKAASIGRGNQIIE